MVNKKPAFSKEPKVTVEISRMTSSNKKHKKLLKAQVNATSSVFLEKDSKVLCLAKADLTDQPSVWRVGPRGHGMKIDDTTRGI